MKFYHLPLSLLLTLSSLVFSCQPEQPTVPQELIESWEAENEILAKHLDLSRVPTNVYFRIHLDRPLSREQQTTVWKNNVLNLGRVMFYDPNLSADRTVSCASCHQQKHAFSDSTAFSTGVYGFQTLRNSYALGSFLSFSNYYNSVLASLDNTPQLFWDNRAEKMHEQILETLANPEEMAMDVSLLLTRLEEQEYYPILYRRVFPDDSWKNNPAQIVAGLNFFVSSLATQDSPFDQELKKMSGQDHFVPDDFTRDFDSFSPSENLGKKLFFANCASCHGRFLGYEADRLFTQIDSTAACNGLSFSYADQGVGKVQNNPDMDGCFKVPSLKNIGVTAPYMHDGRFATLREVIEFYNEDIQPHANLHPLLQDSLGQPIRLNLTENEVDAMVDFLHTLTDEAFLVDERWSDPFLY
jgi:cytochrome c peroxidase